MRDKKSFPVPFLHCAIDLHWPLFPFLWISAESGEFQKLILELKHIQFAVAHSSFSTHHCFFSLCITGVNIHIDKTLLLHLRYAQPDASDWKGERVHSQAVAREERVVLL